MSEADAPLEFMLSSDSIIIAKAGIKFLHDQAEKVALVTAHIGAGLVFGLGKWYDFAAHTVNPAFERAITPILDKLPPGLENLIHQDFAVSKSSPENILPIITAATTAAICAYAVLKGADIYNLIKQRQTAKASN